MRWTALLALGLLTACGSSQVSIPTPVASQSRTSASASPSAATSPGHLGSYGVFVNYLPQGSSTSGPEGVISIVATDGSVVAVAKPVANSQSALVPGVVVSITRTAVYFLNGSTQVQALTPDGTIRDVTTVAGGGHAYSTFAVSPDDRRIAVATLDNSSGQFKASLYVEDLTGHTHHSLIYTATLTVQGLGYPIFEAIGWHAGHIVIFRANDSPFSGYHMVDAATAQRLWSACPNGWEPSGNPEPAGTLCVRGSTDVAIESWDGRLTLIPNTPDGPYCTGLSPQGTLVACSATPIVVHQVSDGSPIEVSASRVVLGFIDEAHLAVYADNPQGNSIVDVTTGYAATTSAQGYLAGSLPGGLD